ncbi:MAG: hypothetical protein VX988_10980 [Planctomycetota bacterium]|nr:hypothetical protein [Planctomycetota bacterium]
MTKFGYRRHPETVLTVVVACVVGLSSMSGCEIPAAPDEAVAQAGPPEPVYLKEGSEEEKELQEAEVAEEEKDQVKAGAGTGAREPSPSGIIATPINVYFTLKERIVFQQVENGLKFFYATKGRKPKDFKEVLSAIIKTRELALPKLKPGDEYVFNPDEGRYGAVMVRSSGTKAEVPTKPTSDGVIAAIEKLGGKVEVDKNEAVVLVDLNLSEVTDAGLMHLRGLKNLKELKLFRTKVTDAGLVHLKGLTGLEELNLTNTEITDAGLVHLKELSSLGILYLYGTKVTDAGLVHLTGLTKLKWLRLESTKVTDAGVKKLKQALPKCIIEQ